MSRLAGKRALITGGTTGIGLETARQFLKEGARVAITGRNPANLDAARRDLGADVLAIEADAADPTARFSAVNRPASSRSGRTTETSPAGSFPLISPSRLGSARCPMPTFPLKLPASSTAPFSIFPDPPPHYRPRHNRFRRAASRS